MAIDLGTVMDELGVALATIAGLNVFDFPPLSADPPFAFVNLPESIDYDLTYGRGSDRMTLEVWVGVANQIDESSRDALAAYASGSGSKSVKAAIEAATVGTSAHVTKAEFATIALSSGSYAGITFSIDVAA